MKRISTGFLILLTIAIAIAPALAQDGDGDGDGDGGWEYDDGLKYRAADRAFSLALKSLLQVRATAENPELGDSGESFDIPRFKIRLVADVEYWEFTVQANLAEGSETENNLLEDAFVRYTKRPLAQFWFGQGKVQFGRQSLTPSSELQFVDRSIAATEFLATGERSDNRDVGIALMGKNLAKTYAYSIGVYNGNGINKDEKDNSDYMAAARLVAMPFGEFLPSEVSVDRPEEPLLAVGISVVSLTRGTATLEEEIRDTTAALEFAFARGGLNMSGEFFTRSGDTPLSGAGSEIDSDGWYFQGGYLFKNNLEIALRYAEVLRDTVNLDETEGGVAVNYYFRKHDLKLQADFRNLDFEAPPSSPDINRDVFRFQMQFGF